MEMGWGRRAAIRFLGTVVVILGITGHGWGPVWAEARGKTPIYSFPFAPGEEFVVGQADHMFPTHEGKFAVDWIMDEGTPIHAARGGTVVDTCDRFTEHGAIPEMIDKSNYVVIRHDDGSFATYIHLLPKGVKVKVGQKVKEGQLIALSGNTGYTEVPHLHFEVYRMVGNRRESLPTPFKLVTGEVAQAVHAAKYRAPGGVPKPETGPLAGVVGSGELAQIPRAIVAMVKAEKDLPKAARLLKDHFDRHLEKYKKIYVETYSRAQKGDKTAMRDLQDFMAINLHQEPEIARLLADASSEAVAYEAMGQWWQRMTPLP